LKNTEGATTIPSNFIRHMGVHSSEWKRITIKMGEKMSRYDYTEFVGKIFGTLQVVEIGRTNKHRKKMLIVKCLKHDDVEPFEVVKQSLINGSTQGCKECHREKHQTHGKHNTREYHIFKGMIARIKDESRHDFHLYGGRGIDVDPRYDPEFENQGIQKAFETFFEDIGEIPEPLTLDRIDNNKGYWKDNLRLATYEEQLQNRRHIKCNENIAKLIYLEYNNNRITHAQLAKKYNVSEFTVYSILNKRCWKNVTKNL
jgi:hypothetical protein